mmetsp:Transcript_13633/g.29618  ORF Transcript_13633/g.29618 Transcript_13633/m.29618 type:complete len:725 (+) Transcript_13633:171-2345(+)
MTLQDEIKTAMSSVGLALSDDMLSRCVGISTNLHVTPEQLAETWEAHSLNSNVNELNNLTFDAYRNALRKEFDSTSGTGGARPRQSSSGIKVEPGTSGAVVSRAELGKRNNNNASALVTPPPSKRHNLGGGGGAADAATSAVDTVGSTTPADSPNGKKATGNAITPAPSTMVKPLRTAKYGERTNVGQTVATYNPDNLPEYSSSAADGVDDGAPRCTIDSQPRGSHNVTKPYRYMFTPLEDRAKALDDHLVGLGEEIMERFDIKAGIVKKEEQAEGAEVGAADKAAIAPLEAVGIPRQDAVCCIGRICNEAHEGKINRTSVLLEGSRHHSNGARVNLDLSSLTSSGTSYSLFPGQIIAVEGLNSSGRKMVAQRICEGAARPSAKTSVDSLMRYHHGATDEACQDGKPLKIMAMSGPYTTSDSLDYEPLLDALNQIREDRPDVVIMTGPFVDMRQPDIASGNIFLEFEDGGGKMNVTCEALFVNKVAAVIESLYEEDPTMRTQFILVPSLDDAVAEFVYPQPPLSDRLKKPKVMKLPGAEGIEYGTLGLQHIETAGRGDERGFKRVHCVSNPCTLQINEVIVGVTSTDAMLHISTDETNANLEPGSRLSRIAQHLLQQRSYYPLFPPPAAQTMATNVDLAHMNEWSMPCQPDLLIIPSKLTTFAKKVLDHSVVVNPGMLTRGSTGGTYAIMDVHPMKRDMLESAGADIKMENSLPDRVRVDIKRI